MEKIKLGISTCLLGENVRFDGGHKLDRYLTDTLGQFVEYVPVCPEVECGFGVPRESFRLVGDPGNPRLVTSRTNQDHTERMAAWAKKRVAELEKENLCGFIFKSGSPSSGMERVRMYDHNGVPSKVGVGIFARIFMDHFPLLPVEEEGRLHDPRLRENFIERIFALKRWRDGLKEKPSLKALVAFHTRNKLLLLAHSPQHHRQMGRLVAGGRELPLKELYARYQEIFLEALQLKTTNKKHTNVLMHMLGYFKGQLSAGEKQEMLELIEQYRLEALPIVVPMTLMSHYVRKYNESYLKEQTYLQPHPAELHLRNHV
ncbi:MAG: hypothetical protein H6Q43_1263 [Deltaproteobacteria bacterium]|nr:hypothetical protein [Deltaproteobacteria bacterium]MBP1717825.1 hypothetical protein [Deltaproteobacteria bacterium]